MGRNTDSGGAESDPVREEPVQDENNNENMNVEESHDDDSEAIVRTLDTENVEPVNETLRFIQMTIACFAMICGSASYAFNIYSGTLQTQYGYDFRKMSIINTVGMVFCYFLLPYGFVFDMFGSRPIYILACILFPLGALLMGLTFHKVIVGSVVRFAVYNALLSLGSQLFDLATVVTLLLNFPTRKGWVIALLKTLMGLGQALLATMESGFFRSHPPFFFYFLMGLVVVVGIAVQIFIRLPSYHLTGWEERRLTEQQKKRRTRSRAAYLTQVPPMWRFWWGLIIICILIVYLPLTSALAAFLKLDERHRRDFAIGAVVIFCCILFMMAPIFALDNLFVSRAHKKEAEERRRREEETREYDEKEFINLKEEVPEGAVVEPFDDGLQRQDDTPRPVRKTAEPLTDIDFIAPAYQTSFVKNLCSVTLWCIVWTFFCGVGSEFVVIFNARYIYGALDGGPTDNTVNTLLSVINGVGSAVGRLCMSYFEVLTVRQKAEDRIPITFSFFVPTACIIISIVLFLVLPGKSLLVAFSLTALGNGFCASVTILVIQTIYAKDCAKHYNFGYNSLWIAAIVLNRFLFGEWFATRAEKKGAKICYGKDCVLMPMLVMLGLNVTAFLSDIYLHISYTRFSKRVLDERRRLREGGTAAMEPAAEKVLEE
ncbi:Nodulin-like/Major Facilitator Superfamily, putative [Angomonas deanei]|uniref:Nodulin-like/Major Facilitator Superfamily, putative n=1 Tax=Angomonas deanei TaxID=59799 RepID=A0A7G2CSR4_9TRYP|nr:Nodulin-like/Major Facilitator Superfamily, putative [Angomonas deanei]